MRTHAVLSRLARFGVRMGLTRSREILRSIGDPHLARPVVHIAGTNGKGSVVRMMGAMLRARGLKVGEMTSPHLQHLNERIVVDGQPISDVELDSLLRRVAAARDHWVREELQDELPAGEALTYFEMVTIAGFLHFAENGVDVCIVEVGLGGRLDATNVVAPVATAIVSVGMDHMDQLGTDLASIAAEKAGIVKAGCPLVVGPLAAQAIRVVRTIAHDRGAPLLAPDAQYTVRLGRDHDVQFTLEESEHWPRVDLEGLALNLEGEHQVANAGVALALAHALPASLRPDAVAIAKGLASVAHPGRLEWLSDSLLIDCAHNGDGAVRLAVYLRSLPDDRRPDVLLLGMSEDKDARAVVAPLAPYVGRILTTHCAHPRAVRAGELASRLVGIDVPILPAGPVEQALPMALAKGKVVVAGSIFLAGAVRDLVLGEG